MPNLTNEMIEAASKIRDTKLRLAQLTFGRPPINERLQDKVNRLRQLKAAKDRAHNEYLETIMKD